MLLRRIMWYLGSIHCGMLYVWLISFHCWLHARAALLTGTCQLLRLVHDTQLDCLFWMFFINLACFHRKPLLDRHWLSWNIYSWLLNALNNNLDHQTQTSHQPSTNNVLLIRTSRQISCNSWLIIPHDNSWKKNCAHFQLPGPNSLPTVPYETGTCVKAGQMAAWPHIPMAA